MTTRQDFDTRFDQMGKDIDDMIADDREDLREERLELKERWNQLNARRSEIDSEGENAWERFKDEMDTGWKNIKSSFDDLRNRLTR